MKKNILKFSCMLFIFMFTKMNLSAQHEYDTWVFGKTSGFNTVTGTSLASPSINTRNGCAVYCNSAGNLWVYTDGTHIYNLQTNINCAGCLNGNPNNGAVNTDGATQGVVMFPKPGGPAGQFYTFTVSDAGPTNYGLSYDVYDQTAGTINGETSMGWALNTYGSFCSERITAIPHANGTDYWIIVKPIIFPAGTPGAVITSTQPATQPAGATNSSLYAYLVTASGVSATPVISNAGFASSITTSINTIGEVKCSPDKQFLAITERTSTSSGNTHLYRFNDNTGQISLLQSLPYLSGYAPWGLSFSKNSKALYVCGSNATNDNLRQYDITGLACNPTLPPPACDLSNQLSAATVKQSQLQLAPDGKIYRSRYGSQYIDIISTPNNIGCANIGYQALAQQVTTNPLGQCLYGLPNNIDALAGQNSPTTAWPKTTSTTYVNDQANAIESDQNGDVYAAGQFRNQTYFEGLLVGNPGVVTQTYLAKYDNCSGLEWVARAQATTSLTVNSMTLERGLGYVYYTGRYSGSVRFYSGITPSGANSCTFNMLSLSGSGVYIAIYDYSGCLLSLHSIPDGALQHLSAHITVATQFSPNPSQKRVYLAVNESDGKTITLHALAHVAAPALTTAWSKTTVSTVSASAADISSYKNTVCMTGKFGRDINWNGTGIFGATASGMEEAFVLAISDISNTPTAFLSKDIDAGNSTGSVASGVHCLNSADIYLTGYYTNFIEDPFSIGTGHNLLANGNLYCGYAVRYNTGNTSTNWARCIKADYSVYALDIFALGTAVYLTGFWEGSSFYADNTLLPPTLISKRHLYMMQMETNGNFNTAPCWQNHSKVNNDANDWVRPSRITANASYVYVDGFYSGTASMLNETGANAPLTSTASTFNSFVWRYNPLAAGISLRQPGEELAATENPEAPVLFPNPATTIFNIDLKTKTDQASRIEVYSVNGELLFSKTTNAAREQIDASQWAPGIYLVRIIRADEIFSQKLIKE